MKLKLTGPGRNTDAVATEFVIPEFATVVEMNQQKIFRFLLASSRDADLAQTLTQECFLKAYRSWPGFRGDSNAGTWLMRIAINIQKDHWRSRRIQFWKLARNNSVNMDLVRDSLASDETSPEQRVLALEQVKQVWVAVDRMKERQRSVFLLRYVEDLKVSEIVLATGMNESTVKTHLYRALKIVRATLAAKRLVS